jgi:tetratricopeptide (TPR) repeat protein
MNTQAASSALQQATQLLESSPLRFPVELSRAQNWASEREPQVVTELEKELELAVQREANVDGAVPPSSGSAHNRNKNYATLNNGVYYWSLPSVLLEHLHDSDPALGESVVQTQQAYARFKTYEMLDTSPEHVEILIKFGSKLQDVYYSVEHSRAFVEKNHGVLKDLLECTVALYKEAHDMGITINSSNAILGKILFSWAVVLSDLARLAQASAADGGDRLNEEKLEYAVASCLKYSGVVSIQEDNIQALNNWGLVICDLANYYKGGENTTSTRRKLYKLAISRFRQALRRSHDSGVDRKVLARCSYNMGSVMYQCCSIADESDTEDVQVAHAAQYVMLAYALDPASKVFQKAVGSIKQFLPLPFLRFSKLVHVYDETKETADQVQQWRLRSLVLDGYNLKTVEVRSSEVTDMEISVQDVMSCSICVDPWIPTGVGMRIRHRGSKHCVYVSSHSQEDLQGLQDALLMLRICSSSGLQALAEGLGGM